VTAPGLGPMGAGIIECLGPPEHLVGGLDPGAVQHHVVPGAGDDIRLRSIRDGEIALLREREESIELRSDHVDGRDHP
jgi:hypothetical protein